MAGDERECPCLSAPARPPRWGTSRSSPLLFASSSSTFLCQVPCFSSYPAFLLFPSTLNFPAFPSSDSEPFLGCVFCLACPLPLTNACPPTKPTAAPLSTALVSSPSLGRSSGLLLCLHTALRSRLCHSTYWAGGQLSSCLCVSPTQEETVSHLSSHPEQVPDGVTLA